jgi:hypothetical protein
VIVAARNALPKLLSLRAFPPKHQPTSTSKGISMSQPTAELNLIRRRQFRFATLAIALIAVVGEAGTARAGLVISAPTIHIAAGTSGSFDIVITNDNPVGGSSFSVAADSLDLALSGLPGVTFTDATIATAIPYLFVQSGTTQGAGPLSLDTFPNTAFLASDSEFASPGFAEIGPGMTFGLAHVSFTIDRSAEPGDRALVLGAGTSLSDVALAPVEFTTADGVLSISPVPEPSTWLLLASAVAVSLTVGRGRTGTRRVGGPR